MQRINYIISILIFPLSAAVSYLSAHENKAHHIKIVARSISLAC